MKFKIHMWVSESMNAQKLYAEFYTHVLKVVYEKDFLKFSNWIHAPKIKFKNSHEVFKD